MNFYSWEVRIKKAYISESRPGAFNELLCYVNVFPRKCDVGSAAGFRKWVRYPADLIYHCIQIFAVDLGRGMGSHRHEKFATGNVLNHEKVQSFQTLLLDMGPIYLSPKINKWPFYKATGVWKAGSVGSLSITKSEPQKFCIANRNRILWIFDQGISALNHYLEIT